MHQTRAGLEVDAVWLQRSIPVAARRSLSPPPPPTPRQLLHTFGHDLFERREIIMK